MKMPGDSLARRWRNVAPAMLPFADAAAGDLSLARLLRLSMFQFSVGMAVVLLNGTLNRVMIVELGMSATVVALMVSLPLVFAPLRALIGFRSDTFVSAIGWRRVPFIWIGSLLQFGGFAIMPFALLLMSSGPEGTVVYGQVAAALAFLLVGAGLHTTQTAGLALATDIAPEEARPRVVALLFVMLLLGMLLSALCFGWLLRDYSHMRLIQVIQGAAVMTMAFNMLALWKQETVDPEKTREPERRVRFREAWRALNQDGRSTRLLLAVGLGTAGFTMQDILLEPFGGQVLGLSVGATTGLTAILAAGTLAAFAIAARWLRRGLDPQRLAAIGALFGVVAFIIISFVAGLQSVLVFRASVALIGFGAGLFAVGTLIAAMDLARTGGSGLALGAWGAVQATATGVAIAAGGALRDGLSHLAEGGYLGPALMTDTAGYSLVYQFEVVLLFATLVVIGPMAKFSREASPEEKGHFGVTEFPH
jgi:BCD family chlorophyll transporter-like MFS transporter